MERTRFRSIHLRPRRASTDPTLDLRLMRSVSLLLLAPVAVLALAISRPDPLPPPALPSAFDGAAAAFLANELAQEYPVRVPGSSGADGARRWLRERLSPYGVQIAEDTWQQDVPGLGPTSLTNVSVVVPGALDDSLVFVAHLDNDAVGGQDNASGVAALIELARAFAATESSSARARQPLHRLVFLWTDAGAHGSLGALRFAERDARTKAAVVLDGVGGSAAPRIRVVGAGRTAAPANLVQTVTARLAAEADTAPHLATVPSQLVALAVPAAPGEHAVLLGRGIAALGVSTGPEGRSRAGADLSVIDSTALGELGAGIDTALATLDAAVQLPRATRTAVYVRSRVVPGWAIEALLVAMLVPAFVAVADLLARCRRRGIPTASGWREMRRRLWPWLGSAVAIGVAALAGELPGTGASIPTPSLDGIAHIPVVALTLAGLLWLAAVIHGRRRPTAARPTTEADRLAGWVVALAALCGSALLTAVVSPYALVFVIPSLVAWVALAALPITRAWLADLLLGIGYAPTAAALAILALEHDLGVRVPLYVAAQLTTGAIPWLAVPAAVLWTTAAGQIAALSRGSYAPSTRRR